MYSTCLAGSIARGKTDVEDELLGKTLLNDDKNLMEHQFVVDMIKVAMEDIMFRSDDSRTTSVFKIKTYPTSIYTCYWKSKSRYFTSFI